MRITSFSAMKKNIAVNLTGNSTDGSIASGYQFYSFGTASDNLSYAGANYKSGAGGGYLANAIAPFSWVPRGTYLGFSTGISAVSDSLVSFSLLTSGQLPFFWLCGHHTDRVNQSWKGLFRVECS